mmetsp:Transcript_40459/g.93013  ORF Transcript_40459/g.93013 Transcript_40459/m.93013 type:complete len:208 (-) Transcript_40459:1548-2171(-)
MKTDPLPLDVLKISLSCTFHLHHHLLNVIKYVLGVLLQQSSHTKLGCEGWCQMCPHNTHHAFARVGLQAFNGLCSGRIDAVKHGAIENQVLESAIMRNVVVLLILDVLHEVAGQGIRRGKEDVSLQADHKQPMVHDVTNVSLHERAASLNYNTLAPSLWQAIHDGDFGILEDERDEANGSTDCYCYDELSSQDKHAHDEKNLQPLKR